MLHALSAYNCRSSGGRIVVILTIDPVRLTLPVFIHPLSVEDAGSVEGVLGLPSGTPISRYLFSKQLSVRI